MDTGICLYDAWKSIFFSKTDFAGGPILKFKIDAMPKSWIVLSYAFLSDIIEFHTIENVGIGTDILSLGCLKVELFE